MKSIVPLFLTAMFVVACSESKTAPEKKVEQPSAREKQTTADELYEIKRNNADDGYKRPITKGVAKRICLQRDGKVLSTCVDSILNHCCNGN